MEISPTTDEFVAMGRALGKYDDCGEKIGMFVDHYGVEPHIVSLLWNRLVSEDSIVVAFESVDELKPIYLLYALKFLRSSYCIKHDENFKHLSWLFVEAIANLDGEYVSVLLKTL